MSLTLPRSSSTNSKRNSARLDLLSMMLNSSPTQKKKSSSASDSPHDSLSPLDDVSREDLLDRGRSRSAVELSRVEESTEGECFPFITTGSGS